MKYVRSIVLALLTALACPAFAKQEVVRVPYASNAAALRSGGVYYGLNCKNARDLRQLFRTSAWLRPLPDPELAVLQVNRAAHDPRACLWSAVPYSGRPEEVDRIVRNPRETYTIQRFTVDDGTDFPSVEPEYRYGLQ
jgi:hypothetical protein